MNDKTGVGALIICPKTERVLLNLRAPHKTHSLSWSLWGGMIEGEETPKNALLRELREEIGFDIEIERIYPFDIYESRDKHFRYYTFVCIVDEEFTPILNSEAVGYCWVSMGVWPKPMHSGARRSFCSNKSLEKLSIIMDQHKI